MWTVILGASATKQYNKHVARSILKSQVDKILDKLAIDPFAPGNHFKALTGEMAGLYSRRIDAVNRVVYAVEHKTVVVHVLSVWGHYDDT